MKRVGVAAVVLAFLCCTSVSFAHPGRTDSSGGHYNRSTGEYHYHHGYPEHQHVNNTCPHDFDDRTGENSGSSTSSSREPPTISTRKMPTISTGNGTQAKTSTSNGGIAKKILLYVIVCAVGMYVCYKVIDKCAKIHEERVFVRNHGSVKFADQLRPQLQEIKKRRLELQQKKYFSPRKVCGVPNEAFLNDKLLPCTKGAPAPFGKYTVFYNFNTKKFHFAHCIYARYGREMNILNVPIDATPCYRCLYSGPPLDWIDPYREYMAAFKVIGINPEESRP